MMDHYSNKPAPSIDICIEDVKNKIDEYIENNNIIITNNLDISYNIDDIIKKAIYMSDLLDENKNIKYSFIGWNTFGITEVLEYIKNNINDINIEIDKKRKLKGLLKSSFILLSIYIKSKKSMYHPDSNYVNTNLKNNFYTLSYN